jgi:hypothetical protein
MTNNNDRLILSGAHGNKMGHGQNTVNMELFYLLLPFIGAFLLLFSVCCCGKKLKRMLHIPKEVVIGSYAATRLGADSDDSDTSSDEESNSEDEELNRERRGNTNTISPFDRGQRDGVEMVEQDSDTSGTASAAVQDNVANNGSVPVEDEVQIQVVCDSDTKVPHSNPHIIG